MKKCLFLLLCVMLLTSVLVSSAAASGWEQLEINPVPLKMSEFSNPDQRRQGYAGPNANAYLEAGAYKPWKVTSSEGWLVEGEYVLTNFVVQGGATRVIYFRCSGFDDKAEQVPEKQLVGLKAIAMCDIEPLFGPGKEYTAYEKKDAYISLGTEIAGFFAVGDYVFCEFTARNGRAARGWVLAEDISMQRDDNGDPIAVDTAAGSVEDRQFTTHDTSVPTDDEYDDDDYFDCGDFGDDMMESEEELIISMD